VLDGGEKEVFLGGSRLNKFMETVESATAAIPEALLEDSEEALRYPTEPEDDGRPRGRRRGKSAPMPAEPEEETQPSPAAAPADPWGALLQTGMALLQNFVGGSKPAGAAPAGGGKPALGSLVTRDERTGETYLKVPVPAPEVLDQALQAVGALLQSLRR
jgi:hypothetical protein